MPNPISWSFAWPYLIGFFAAGYLLGSVPFGLLLTKAAGLGDIRQIGSGNIGATNVLRTGRKGIAAATLIFDALKGAIAVLIAQRWGPDAGLMAGLGAFLGHLFPVWLGFRGGKGMATALGVLITVSWPVGIAACATWVIVAVVTRYSSVASLITTVAASGYGWIIAGDLQLVEFAAILAVLVWVKHHGNIRRLLAGTESKIALKQPS